MKRPITILLALAALPFAATAQDKGFLSGTLSVSSRSTDLDGEDGPKTTAITIGPVVGFNMSEQVVVGAELTYTSDQRSEFDEVVVDNTVHTVEEKHTTSLFTIAPFMRYMHKVDEDFLLYGQAKVGVGFGTDRTEVEGPGPDTETESALSTFDIGVGPGLVYVFAPRWAVNADWGLLGYASTTRTDEVGNDEVKTTTSGFDLRLNPGAITFGLNWLF